MATTIDAATEVRISNWEVQVRRLEEVLKGHSPGSDSVASLVGKHKGHADFSEI